MPWEPRRHSITINFGAEREDQKWRVYSIIPRPPDLVKTSHHNWKLLLGFFRGTEKELDAEMDHYVGANPGQQFWVWRGRNIPVAKKYGPGFGPNGQRFAGFDVQPEEYRYVIPSSMPVRRPRSASQKKKDKPPAKEPLRIPAIKTEAALAANPNPSICKAPPPEDEPVEIAPGDEKIAAEIAKAAGFGNHD